MPLPERNIRIAAGDAVGWEAFPTPGHASHHVCYFRDGVLLAGDACGIRLQPERYILPPTPPPDIDVEAWHASIDEIARREPECLALIHFGVESDVPDHLARLHEELDRWAGWVRDGIEPGRVRRAAPREPAAARRGRPRRDRRARAVVARAAALLGQARLLTDGRGGTQRVDSAGFDNPCGGAAQ